MRSEILSRMSRSGVNYLLVFVTCFSCGHSEKFNEELAENGEKSSAVHRSFVTEEVLRRVVTLLGEEFNLNEKFDQDPIISLFISSNQTDLDFEDVRSELSRVNATVAAIRTEFQTQSQALADIKSRLADHPSADTNIAGDVLTKKEYLRDTSIRFSNFKGAIKCTFGYLEEFQESSRDYNDNDTISATLKNYNQSLLIEWKLPVPSCNEFMTAVWIWVYERNQGPDTRVSATALNSSAAIQIPKKCLTKKSNVFSITLPSNRESCQFPLIPLLECKSYSVQIVHNYNSFFGPSVSTIVNVPPLTEGNSTQLHSITTLAMSTSLDWNWKIKSADCASQLSSVQLRIYDETTEDTTPVSEMKLTPSCFSNQAGNFSASLRNSSEYCPGWSQLNRCSTYRMEIETEFLSTWKGLPSSTDFFTNEQGSTRCCHLFTASKGSFGNPEYHGYGQRPERCSWLITAEPNQNIWLTFKYFRSSNHYIWVYDGGLSTSPLILQYRGYSPPLPIRSRGNKMLVEYQTFYHYHYNSDYEFSAAYVTVNDTGTPYTSGCGGYLINEGTINSPANSITSECIWYIESENNSTHSHSIVLDSVTSDLSSRPLYSMQVYDGWDSESKLVHSQSGKFKSTIYTPGNKARLHLRNSPNAQESYSWKVTRASNPCGSQLTNSSGTIKSPNYPNNYSNLLDCRWNIQVRPKSTVNLHLAYLDTQKSVDLVYVYDGSSVYAPVLLEISGELTTPITVNSTSNEMLVRFVSNYETTRTGFLALYSS